MKTWSAGALNSMSALDYSRTSESGPQVSPWASTTCSSVHAPHTGPSCQHWPCAGTMTPSHLYPVPRGRRHEHHPPVEQCLRASPLQLVPHPPRLLGETKYPEGDLHLQSTVWTWITELESLVYSHVISAEQLTERDLQIPQGTLMLFIFDLQNTWQNTWSSEDKDKKQRKVHNSVFKKQTSAISF